MKAKRRQELHTNDLAQAIDTLRQSFRQWGVYILGGVAVVLAVYAITRSIQSTRTSQVEDAYSELNLAGNTAPGNVPKSDDDLLDSLDKMDQLAADSANVSFKLDATHQRAEFALSLSLRNPEGPQKEFLEKAHESFSKLIADFSDRKLYSGRGHYGLFQVEAGLFAIDGDPSRKAAATKHLEAIRDDSAFAGTPLMSSALDRLNEIDKLFTKVEFEKAPPPPEPILNTETIKIPVSNPGPEASITIPTVGDAAADSDSGSDDSEAEGDDTESGDVEEPEADTDSDASADSESDSDSKEADSPETDDDSESANADDAESPQP